MPPSPSPFSLQPQLQGLTDKPAPVATPSKTNPSSRAKDFFAVIGFLTVLAALSYGMVKSTPFILRTGIHAAVSASNAVFFPTKLDVSPTKITLYEKAITTISWKITGGNSATNTGRGKTKNSQGDEMSYFGATATNAFQNLVRGITKEKDTSQDPPKPLLPAGSFSISYPCVDGIYFMVQDSATLRPTFCNTLNGLVPATASIKMYPLRSAELVRTSADRTSTSTPVVPVTISYYKNGAKKPLIFDSVFVSVPR